MKYILTFLSIFAISAISNSQFLPEQPNCFGEVGYIPNNSYGDPNACHIIYLSDVDGNEVELIQTESNSYRYDVYPGIYIPIYSSVCTNNVLENDTLIIQEPFKLIESYPAFDCNSDDSFIEIYNNGYELTITNHNGDTVSEYLYESMGDGIFKITIEPGIYTISGYRQSCTQQPMPFTVNTIYPNSASVKLLSNGEDNTSLNIVSGTTVNFEGVITDYYGNVVEMSCSWETTGGIEPPSQSDLVFSRDLLDIGTYTVSLAINDGVCEKTDNLTIVVSEAISVDEVDSNISYLQLDGQIKVSQNGEFEYTIYSIDGKVIESSKAFNYVNINTSNFQKGIIILNTNNKSKTNSKKIFIN